jgi:integrase
MTLAWRITLKRLKISDVLAEYYASLDFEALGSKTKYDYKYCLSALCDTVVGHSRIGGMYITTLTVPKCQRAYDTWVRRGIPFANHTQAVASKFYNYAIQRGYVQINPFSSLSKRPAVPRKVVWSSQDISRFLDTAYSQFKWRSVGLIVHMAYAWCQRLGDMANLRWDNLDLDAGVLYLQQSKRRAKVEIPIDDDDLLEMLRQQKEDVGYQDRVAPVCTKAGISHRSYEKSELSAVGREIMRAAGLPEELQIMDMRRTGTTEMINAGVPLTNIMMVTGHQSPASLKPYIKNTLIGARVAMDARKKLLTDSKTHDSLEPRRTGGESLSRVRQRKPYYLGYNSSNSNKKWNLNG